MGNVITTILEKLKITKPLRNEKAGYFLMHDSETDEVSAIPVESVLAKLNDRIDGVIYPDGFTKTTAINRVGNTVSIAPYDFAWRIQLNPYTNAAAFSKTLDPTASGELKRIDALAVTTLGTIVHYKGEEDEFIVKPPKVPTNELRLTDFTIFGDDVQEHTEPFISEVYTLSEKQKLAILDATSDINKPVSTDQAAADAATLSAANSYTDSKIPSNYSKIVYVNNTSPTTATIFDLNNPPVTNDNVLKTDVNNLYIGTDASTWVYNSTTSTYVTKVVVNLFPVEVTGNQTVLESWNGKDVYYMGSGTLTYPNTGLSPGHNFNLYADVGVTIAWSIASPKTWRVAGIAVGTAPFSVTPGQFCMVQARIGTNEIRVLGL